LAQRNEAEADNHRPRLRRPLAAGAAAGTCSEFLALLALRRSGARGSPPAPYLASWPEL